MVNLNTPRHSTLVLSRGAVLDKAWPALRDDFPAGATSHINFLDPTTGATLHTATGVVTPKALTYLHTDTAGLDAVPNGGKYELFITTDDGPYKYEYGNIIRREATFPTVAPPFALGPRTFVDDLGRDAVGRKWIPTMGGIAMHVLSGGGHAMGPDTGLFYSQAGMRWYRPMGTDSWRVTFSVYNTGQIIGLGGTGRMRLHMGCDIHLLVGMAFEIETSNTTANNRVHTGRVTSPTDMDYSGDPAPNTTANGDVWIVEFDETTRVMKAFKGSTAGSPVIELDDPDGLLPHGPGFRYWGFSWDSSLLATGPVLYSVEAKDV